MWYSTKTPAYPGGEPQDQSNWSWETYPLLTAEMPRAFPQRTLSENWEIHHCTVVDTCSGTSSTTTMYILPPNRPPSCSTLANIHGWALNHTSQKPDLRLSMNSKTGWTPHSQRPDLHLQRPKKTWLSTTTNAEFWLKSIISGIEYTWMRVIFVPPILCRNSPIAI